MIAPLPFRFFFTSCLLLLLFTRPAFGQQDRFELLEQRLRDLAVLNPGLNEKVDLSVSGASIQEFLRGLAESNNLNISIDPQLTFKVHNNFTNEKVVNIILFLAREYNLDIRFVGSIMSFTRYTPLAEPLRIVPKEIQVKYNSYNNALSMDLKNDTLEAVVKKITQVTKKNVVLASGLQDRKVSIYLEDMPLEDAIEKMALVNDLKVTKTSDNFFLIHKFEDGEARELAAGPASRGPKNNANGGRKTNARAANGAGAVRVSLRDSLGRKYMDVDAANVPIQEILQTVSEEAGVNYFLYSDLKGNATLRASDVTFDDFLVYLFQGSDYTHRKESGLYLIGDRKLEGLRAHKLFQFQFRSLDAIQDVIPAEIRKGVEIKEFKELNSILLTGSLPQINEIEAFIKQLDRVVPLVLIEVILVDVRKGKSVSTGIRAGVSDSVTSGGTILPGVDFTFSARSINDFLSRLGVNNTMSLGRVSPNFYVGLSALEKNSNVDVRSMPKLSTLNGHEASLSIGSTRYYSIRTQNVVGTLTPQTLVTEQFNAVQANLAINIKPVVAADDQVTLSIDVNISDFIGEPPEKAPPPSSTSQFKSLVRVKNEEMIVLGGLERTERAENGAGVPVLSRIPVLKWLFSSRTKSNTKVVSVVFIKPTIIY